MVELVVEKLPLFEIFKKKNFLVTSRRFFWISRIVLSAEREDSIRDCFTDQSFNHNYPDNIEDFDYLLETCKRDKADYIENDLGEKMVLDKPIVMDDVSGLADKSDEFANFLTVSRKYSITCVYIFHTIYTSRENWQMIISQMQISQMVPFLGYWLLLLVDIKIHKYLIEMFG